MIAYLLQCTISGLDSDGFCWPGAQWGLGSVPALKEDFQLWRLFTPIMLHVNILHITINAVTQLLLGGDLEEFLGTQRLAALYLLSSVGGMVLELSIYPDSELIGASAGIFGFRGYHLAYILFNLDSRDSRWSSYFKDVVSYSIEEALILIMSGPASYGHFAHLGGFITGSLIGFAYLSENYYLAIGWIVGILTYFFVFV